MKSRANAIQILDECVLLNIEGRLDVDTSSELVSNVEYLLQVNHTYIIINLMDISTIESAGLVGLVNCLNAVKKVGSKLELIIANESAHRLFRLTKLACVFDIYPDLSTALSREAPYPIELVQGGFDVTKTFRQEIASVV